MDTMAERTHVLNLSVARMWVGGGLEKYTPQGTGLQKKRAPNRNILKVKKKTMVTTGSDGLH